MKWYKALEKWKCVISVPWFHQFILSTNVHWESQLLYYMGYLWKIWIYLFIGFKINPVSSTNKTDRHDITEILLKVAINTIIHPTLNCCNVIQCSIFCVFAFSSNCTTKFENYGIYDNTIKDRLGYAWANKWYNERIPCLFR